MTPEPVAQLARYRIVSAESAFTVQAFAEGLLSAFGHDPVIVIKQFEGDFEFTPGTFENASLHIKIDPAAMSVADNVKEKDRQEIQRTMQEEVLETKQYPEIAFRSNNITVTRLAEGRYRARVIGDLTLHGVTQRNLWITGEVFAGDDTLRAKGEFSVRQRDYRIKLVSVAGGTLKVKNELKCVFDVVAKKE